MRIYCALAICLAFIARSQAADNLIISEFMASNTGPLRDENGDAEDWIEIHNPGTNAVGLSGWYLSDNAALLTKWQFPATNIAPNGYLIVWASNKDRRVPGKPLHTNFRLNDAGEYLGLVRPDLTIASQYAPAFPLQVPLVSYGVPLVQTVTTLIATGAAARVYVPTNDVLGSTWLAPGFDDSGWLPATTGVGYETDAQGTFTPVVVADSVTEFSGKQGSNNWYYGYWNRDADPNGVYSDVDMSFFPNADGPYGPANFFDGTTWHWFGGNPPFTEITSQGATPNASNGVPARANHWAVRRWVSETAGNIKITGNLQHTGDWAYVTASGVAANSLLYLYLTAAGDGYIDDIKLVAGAVPEVGPNLMPNGDFESPLTPTWTVSDNHSPSAIVTDVKHGGNGSLHMVATVGGTTQGSAIWQTVAPALTVGNTYTLSYWWKPTANNTPLVTRFSGNWISASPAPCGDGVTGHIFVDGVEAYATNAMQGSQPFTVTVPVNFGSRVDFALDPRTNDFCDAAIFTAQIETADPGNIVVADSVADWSFTGTQGEKNWYYGYYNKTADGDGIYSPNEFTPFPRSGNPNGVDNYWTGTGWDWFNGNPPWDEITQTGWHPNGINNAAEHWVIRRWVSEVSGRITVDWTLAKVNLNGNGVTGRIMHNGNLLDSASIAGNNGAGVSRSLTITNVAAGDFIDYALDPNGPGGTDDGSDGSAGTMVIRGTPTLTSAIATDIQSAMQNVNASAYIRIPFTVADPSSINFLTLSMRYDDGFAAYLNGTQVANRNAIDIQNPLTWNSGATANRADGDVIAWDEIDISSFKGLLTAGTNVLAIHGLNAFAADTDFLILPQLRGLNVTLGTNAGYFTSPTPGAANGTASTNIGPIVANVGHTPNVPQDNEDVIVTAQVARSFNNVSNVTMIYRIAYSNEVTVPMLDDGLHGDGAAGDGVYGATIPASAAFPGQMIRYYVSASDIKTNLSRIPVVTAPSAAEPKYFGTIVDLPQTNGLPLFHWFLPDAAAIAAAATDTGARCSIFFNGQFRDNVGVTLHGQSSSGFPKHSYNFNLNKGYKMSIRPDEPNASDFAIVSTWADRTHVRNRINTETYQDAGAPAHYSFALRVQQNESFYMVANFLEQGNEEYLERIGYDPDGALYKMYDTFVSVGTAEKKSRKYEGSADLQTLYNAVSTVNPDAAGRTTYVWDNVNLPNVVNFLAVKAITADHDCCHKNYYFYHDNNVSGEWYALPWDFDLSLSHIWTSGPGYFDDTTYTNNPALGVGNNNTLLALFWNDPVLKSMWLRRTRTLTDTILQPPGTTTNADYLRTKFDAYVDQVRGDSALDKTKWGGASWTPPVYGPANPTLVGNATNNLEIELARIKDFYLPGRRTFLNTPATGLPNSQSNFFLKFGAIDYNPASGNQAQEYVEILNTNNFAVDISGWKMKGEADFTFLPGTVIGITNRIFVTPNLAAFRARPSGPRAGQRMFATGPYKNQLSARGDTLVLINEAGQTNASLTYTGTPSLVQQYLRITELMYHPPPPGIASPYPQEDYEYIELKNIGPVALNLNGVHFTNGVEFTFSSANVTNLAAGATLVLAKNPAAFAFRYPGVPNVTGPYLGLLENAGEKVELDDVLGEIILEFTYNNTWYPMTDGNGFSLVIVNENSPWQTWDTKAAWRPSGTANGSPGVVDPAPVVVGAMVVNEVLAHTTFPDFDRIEIHNPTTNAVDVGDWWLSDDFFTPRKYRIPAPRVIPPGGFTVFIESDFNAGLNAFSFSSYGDEAYLFSGLGSGELSGYYHGFSFGGSETGVSFGRHINSMTNEHFVAQGTNSLGSTNTGPRVGPLIISELMYHPPDVNGADNSLDEYVELQNLTTNAVPLYDPAYPTNRWRLDDGINFTFSTNDVVAAKGFLIVANFNPTNGPLLQAFRTKYGVATNVPVVGPYSGKLDNSEDTVELRRPDAPDTNGTPFVLVERVHYLDSPPWDVGADGIGPSLQRRVVTSAPELSNVAGYGNEPLNWFAALPNAGSPASTGTPPVILQQPLNVLTIAGLSTNISLSVTGTAPLVYQWRRNGANLPGETNAAIQFNPVQPGQAGLYSVAILNAAGYTVSSNALLTVQIPVAFTQQPTNQFVLPGTNVTVAATAVGNGVLRWQWRFEGTNIPGATSNTFSFLNANLTNGHGNFSVVVTDDISTATSSNAFVFVLVRPGVILQPLAQQVVQGNTAMFICQATGAPPIFYRWLTNGVGYTTNTSGIFIYPNAQFNFTVRANVVNGAANVNSSSVGLIVLRDFDGDGIADIWETNYFGFSTNNAADGLLDFDGDGMNNHDEFVAGTNPTNALSLLKIVQSETNANVLQFVAQTNRTYTLLCRTNLTDGLWSAVTNILPSTSVRTISVNSAISPPLNPEIYYRVITPLIP